MAVSKDYLLFIQDQFAHFGEIQIKRMFGGAGIYHQGIMFALVSDDLLYLKADDINRVDFTAENMPNFNPGKASKGMPYWQVPAEVVEDRHLMAEWAEKAYQAAVRTKKK